MLQTAMPSSERGGATFPPAFSSQGASHAPPDAPDVGSRARLGQQAAALRPLVRAVVAVVLGEHRDHADVEDCTHEALRRALEGSSRLRDGEPLRPWLLGIARHVAIDARRKRRREGPMDSGRRQGDGQGDGQDDAESWIDRIVDPSPAPDERAASSERGRRVGIALEGLAAPQREAMLLFHVEGCDYQHIASKLGVPIGTVATWLSRGRRSLADALGEAPSAAKTTMIKTTNTRKAGDK